MEIKQWSHTPGYQGFGVRQFVGLPSPPRVAAVLTANFRVWARPVESWIVQVSVEP